MINSSLGSVVKTPMMLLSIVQSTVDEERYEQMY